MKCEFCNKPVYGEEGVSIPGKGPAHKSCLKAYETMRRTFKGLDITALEDQELADLKDLVLSEENARKGGDEGSDIELF